MYQFLKRLNDSLIERVLRAEYPLYCENGIEALVSEFIKDITNSLK